MERMPIPILLLLVACTAFAQPYQAKYSGTVYLTTITDDFVNVRSLPSLNAKIVRQFNKGDAIAVTGVSEESTTIGSFTGYWVRCRLPSDKDKATKVLGWVYSQFVDGLATVAPSSIAVKSLAPATPRSTAKLTISLSRGGPTRDAMVDPFRQGSQSFYSFTWSDDDPQFQYADVPGTYVWHPESGKVAHVTYGGYSIESAWVIFTDDFMYAMQDFGTSPGPRAFEAWNVATGEQVSSGMYYRNLQVSGHQVETVVLYDDWRVARGMVDPETERHAKEFLVTTSLPRQRPDHLTNQLIVVYTLNLDTRTRAFNETKYIVTQ